MLIKLQYVNCKITVCFPPNKKGRAKSWYLKRVHKWRIKNQIIYSIFTFLFCITNGKSSWSRTTPNPCILKYIHLRMATFYWINCIHIRWQEHYKTVSFNKNQDKLCKLNGMAKTCHIEDDNAILFRCPTWHFLWPWQPSIFIDMRIVTLAS